MKTSLSRSYSQQSSEPRDGCTTEAAAVLVDAHVHVFPPEIAQDREAYLGIDARFDALYSSPTAKMATLEDVLAQMEESGIEKSVIFGFAFSDLGVCKLINDYVMKAVRMYPDRLAGLSVVPWGGTGAKAELERCLDGGMKGCGELAPSSMDADYLARLAPLAAVLRERQLPLLIHASEPVGHAYPGKGDFTPEACVALAQMYPGSVLVLSHMGGGAFLYELMPEVREILADVFYDTAAVPYLYRPEIYQTMCSAAGAQKLLFGSDYPLLDPVRCLQGIERLSSQEQAMVCSDNARRIYGL